MRQTRFSQDRNETHCGTKASITEAEQIILRSGGVKHPIKLINELHDNPDKFKTFLPEFDAFVERVKGDNVKTPCKVTAAFFTYEYAILHVLADKYNTSMSKIGRALVIYSINMKEAHT